MALFEELDQLITERQEELKNYQGAELYLKTAQLVFMKSRRFSYIHTDKADKVKQLRSELEGFRNGQFPAYERLIDAYAKKIETIYKKTGLLPTIPLPEITLAKDGVQALEQETIEYYITDAPLELDDETAEKFRKKFYEKGIPVTTFPVIDDTSFDDRSFAETLNRNKPLTHKYVLNLITDKLRSDLPGLKDEILNPFDYIRIGGKTADEKWAAKYPLLDEREKRDAYAFELLQAIEKGTEEISLLRPIVTKKENGGNEISYSGKIVLIESRKNLERTRVFLSELNDFSNLFTNEYSLVENPGVQIEPGAQKYYDALQKAARKLAQKASSLNYESNTYADFTEAYRDYVTKATEFKMYQLMEMQTSKFEFERSLQGNPQISDEVKMYRRSNISRLTEEIKNFEPRFDKHLEKLQKSFLRVENFSRGLNVTANDNPWEKAANLRFRKLLDNYKHTASLRGWGQTVPEPSETIPLPKHLSWVNRLSQKNYMTNPEQKKQLVEGSEKDFTRINRDRNCDSIFELSLAEITGDEKNTQSVSSYLRDLGFKDRFGTIQSLFCIWVMSEKNFSFREAASLYKAHVPVGKDNQGNDVYPENRENVKQYEKEFLQFCLEHPFTQNILFKNDEPSEELDARISEAQKKSISAWAKLVQNAYGKVMQYSMPDIDYSDPEQVKANEDELSFLAGFAVDAKQELEELVNHPENNKHFDAINYAAESVGGEKNYFGMVTGLKTLQEVANAVYKLPNVFPMEAIGRADMMPTFEFYRANAGRLMCSHRGETVGSIISNYPGEFVPYSPNYNSFVAEKVMPSGIANQNKVKAAAYLFHINEKDFHNFVNEETDKFEKNERDKLLQSDIATYSIGVREIPISDEFRNALLGTRDNNPQSMISFLSEKVEGNLTGKDLVAARFNKMIARNFRGILLQNGINASDLFRINGLNPSEMWGQKYRNVADPTEKEWLYRAEILKCIEKRQDLIQVRMFKFTEDNKVVELEEAPITVYMDHQIMEDTADNIGKYLKAKQEILATLYQAREELSSTQEDPDANFRSDARTGSTQYQAMCLAVKNAISVLESWKATPDRVLEKLQIVDDAAADYVAAKTGIFGSEPKTDSGALRFRCGNNLMGNNYSLHNGKLTQYFRNNHARLSSVELAVFPPNVKPGDNIVDNRLKIAMNQIHTCLRTPQVDLDLEETKEVKDRIKDRLNQIKRERNYVDIASHTPERQAAIRYMMGYLEDKIKEPLNGAPQRMLKYTLVRKAESFWFEVDRLAKNEAFQRYIKEDPEGCRKKWEECTETAKQIKENQEGWLKINIPRPERSFMSYVANVQGNNAQNPEEAIRQLQRDNPAQMQNVYSRLAEVILAQILSGNTKESEMIRNEIAKGIIGYRDVKSSLTNIIQQQGLLRGRTLNRMEARLQSGETAKGLSKTIREKILSAERRDKESKEREIRQTVGMLTAMDLNGDGVIQKNELDSFVNGSRMNFGQNATAEYTAAANRLNSTLRVKVKKPAEGQKVQEVEENVSLNFIPLQNTLGFTCDRTNTLQRDFILWTMGSKNMEFEDAVKICNAVPKTEKGNVINEQEVKDADQLRYEFFEFCRNNPIDSNEVIPPEQRAEKKVLFTANYEKWAKIFAKATENMKKYKIPDVNYRDIGNLERQFSMISILSALGTETNQEMNKMFSRSGGLVSGVKIARETLGDETFRDMNAFWWNLSERFYATGKAYNPLLSQENTKKNEIYKKMMNTAFLREISVMELQDARKLSLGELTDKALKEGTAQNHIATVSEIMRVNAENGYDSFNARETYEFLQGKTDGTFAQKAEKLYKAQFRAEQSKFKKGYLFEIARFRSTLLREIPGIRSALLDGANYNDYRSVCNLLNTKISELKNPNNQNPDANPNKPNSDELTLRDFLNQKFQMLMNSGAVLTVLKEEKIGFEDLFEIENAIEFASGIDIDDSRNTYTLKELLESRFDNLQDSALKEDLKRLELLRFMISGESRIYIRNFEMQNNKYAEATSVEFMPKDETLVNTAETLMQIQEATRDLHDDLEIFKVKLQKSQNNPNANFDSNVLPEGHDQYKELVGKLKRALSVTRDGGKNYSAEQIDRALIDLSGAAGVYFRTHTGIFGGEPIREYGKIRFRNSGLIKTSVDEYLERRERLYRKLPSDVLSSSQGEMLHESATSDALELVNQMADTQGIRQALPTRKDAYQAYLKFEVKRELATFKTVYARNRYPETFNQIPAENVKTAIQYLGELWDKKSKEETLEHSDLKTLLHPQERIRALAANELFLEMYRKNKTRTLEIWENTEKIAKTRQGEVENALETIIEDYGSMAEFVAGYEKKGKGLNDRGDVTPDEVRVKILEKSSSEVGKGRMYGRLAQTIIYGIMNSDTPIGKRLRYEDALNPSKENRQGFFYRLCQTLGTSLALSDMLGEKKWEQTIMDLERGTLFRTAERNIAHNNMQMLNGIDHTATLPGFGEGVINPAVNIENDNQKNRKNLKNLNENEEMEFDKLQLDFSAELETGEQNRIRNRRGQVQKEDPNIENEKERIKRAEKLVDAINVDFKAIDKEIEAEKNKKKTDVEDALHAYNDAEGIILEEDAYNVQEDIDFDLIALKGKEGIDEEMGDLNYFIEGENFFEEGDFEDYELENREIIHKENEINPLEYGIGIEDLPDKNVVINNNENPPKFIAEQEKAEKVNDDSEFEEERISRLDMSVHSEQKDVILPEKKDEIHPDNKIEQDRQKIEVSVNKNGVSLCRKFMEGTAFVPKAVSKDEFFTLRKQAFILVYGADTLERKGVPFSEDELGKQKKKWFTEEPYKTILEKMLRDNTDKELLALIDRQKIPEEVARIREGRPKQINPEGKPEKQAGADGPKPNEPKHEGPKPGGLQ